MKIERVKILFTNMFILSLNGKKILIDTGPPISKERFFEKMQGIGKIDFVILTHTHFDHSGNTIYLKGKGSLIVVHKNENDWLLEGETPKPPGAGHIGRAIMRFSFLKSLNFPPVQPDIIVSEDTRMEGLTIVHTPGHTPGSVSIVYDNIAFCGDLIMNLSWRPHSQFPLFAHDIEKVKDSIKKLINMGVEVFYPAHGRPISVDRLKL